MRKFTCDHCHVEYETDMEGIDEDPNNYYCAPSNFHKDKACLCDDCWNLFSDWWFNKYGKKFPIGMPEEEVRKLQNEASK